MKTLRLTQHRLPWLIYGLLALAVLGPLLKPGYILTVDMVFVPHVPLPTAAGPDYPFWLVLHFLSDVLPAWLIQKFLLWGILVGGALGTHRLLGYFKPETAHDDWRWTCYFAGLLYMFNPFAYSRFMAGQYLLLAGYALIPWLALAGWRLAAQPSRNRAVIVGGLLILIGIVSIHVLGLATLLLVIISGLSWRRFRQQAGWTSKYLQNMVIAFGLVVLANVPYVLANGHTQTVVDAFRITDLQAFATVPGKLGAVANIAALQGFWADARNLYLVPQDMFSWWWLPIAGLWGLVLMGVVWSWRHQRGLCTAFLLLGSITIICALGISNGLIAPLTRWLFEHNAIARGYREPQKFVALLVLIYGYFGGVGLFALLSYARRKRWGSDARQLCLALVFSIPILCTPLMSFGFRSQLHAVAYPSDWSVARNYLQKQSDKPAVLFLPWHLYMRYDFAQRVVASPASKFFGGQIISSNSPELRGATSYAQTTAQASVSQLMTVAHNTPHSSQLLALHIQYVLVAKDFDWKQYAYLQTDPGLELIQNTQTLQLFKVQGDK